MRKPKPKNRLTREERDRIEIVMAALEGRLGEEAQKLAREAMARVRKENDIKSKPQ